MFETQCRQPQFANRIDSSLYRARFGKLAGHCGDRGARSALPPNSDATRSVSPLSI